MTVTANYPIKVSAQNRWNWLLKLAFEVERCLVVIATDLVTGPAWNGELEGSYNGWMESSLVKPEYFQYETVIANETDKFLMDFIDRPADSLGEKFIRLMKQVVAEDQGNMEAVNRAVYATCAAIVRVNGLTSEALAYASGRRDNPSSALLKAWRAGQKMRNYFTLSDLKPTLINDTPVINKKTLLSRSSSSSNRSKRSLYAGADEEVVEMASRAVTSRAKFLLRVPVKLFSRQDTGVDSEDTISPTDTDQLSPYVLPPPAGSDKAINDDFPTSSAETLGPPLPSPPKSAPSKWQLAARGVNLKRQVSNETKNVAEMWYSLVEGAVTIDKLRNVFIHRRKFMERSRNGKELTTTEKVLSFVQSDVEISKLHEMNNLRNKRSISRAKGFDIFYRLLSVSFKFPVLSSSSPPNLPPFSFSVCPFEFSIATVSLTSALDRIRHDDSNYVYSAGLEGSSPEQINMLSEKVSLFEKCCVQVMQAGIKYCYEDEQQTPPLFTLWQAAILHALRAFTMDFEFADHLLVMESGIVECLNQLFKHDISNTLREAASSVLQILVGRFVVFDSGSEPSSEPTELSKNLVFLLSDLLSFYSKGLSDDNITVSQPVLAELFPDTDYLLSPSSCLELTSHGSSYALPHTNIPLHHTFSLRIKRINSPVLDFYHGMKKSDLVGKYVMRGPDWNEDEKKKADGGLGNIGVITQINEETETTRVKWVLDVAGKEYEYLFNFSHLNSSSFFANEKKCKEEVVLADPNIAGFVFSKGSDEIGCNYEIRSFLPWITHISMQILPDATLLVFYKVFGRDLMQLKSKSRVRSDSFTHVAVTVDVLATSRLFIDGTLEDTVILVPVASEELEEFESDHPLSSSSFSDKRIFQSKFSDPLILSFDEKSSFGPNKGCFLLLESASPLENNNEAFSTAISEFSAGNPAFVVPSSQFSYLMDVQGVTETETGPVFSEAWGFKGYISGYSIAKRSETLSVSSKLPLYVGHPSNIMNFEVNSLLKGVNARLSSFCLYPKALTEQEIKSLILSYQQLTSIDTKKSYFKEEIVLNMFGILKKAVDNLESLNDSAMRRCFSASGLLSLIFSFFLKGTAVVRCAAYRLASFVFPYMEVELINAIASRNGLISNNSHDGRSGFLGFLFDQIGLFCNIFSKRSLFSSTPNADKVLTSVESAEDQQAVVESQVLLFQSFATENSLWTACLHELLAFQLNRSIDIVNRLREVSKNEMRSYNPFTFKPSSNPVPSLSEANSVLSLVSLLGGATFGLSLGTNCLYCDPSSGIIERVTILGISSVPAPDSSATEEERKKWFNMKNYGDAISVMINYSSSSSAASLSGERFSDSILTVPRYSLLPLSNDAATRSCFTSFIAEHFSNSAFPFKDFFHLLFTADITDSRDKPALLENDVIEEAVYESVHPYNNNSDDFKEISFDGAYKLEIFFDEQSRTASTDFIQFYKDGKRSECIGERYCGRVGFFLLLYSFL
jgi:hypothetical protein